MLSIQSSINQASFGSRNRRNSASVNEDRELQQQRAELAQQRREFEALANDKDAPSTMQKAAKLGAVLTAGTAVGLTAGCGSKILIDKVKVFKNSKFMKNVKDYGKSFKVSVKKSFNTIKDDLKKTSLHEKIVNKFNKFSESKFGKPIVTFFRTIKNMIKAGFGEVKKGFNWIKNKIKGVKSETYEKAAVGTVGVSSGACAAINSFKKEDEAGE